LHITNELFLKIYVRDRNWGSLTNKYTFNEVWLAQIIGTSTGWARCYLQIMEKEGLMYKTNEGYYFSSKGIDKAEKELALKALEEL
jgi:hypothetical protein